MRFNPLLHGTTKSWDEARKPHKGGGGGGGGTSTTTQDIPAELKPLASAYTTKAIDLGNQSYDPYQGQRYADLNQTQNYGIGMVQNRAVNGSNTINNAESNLNQIINGNNYNPYLDQMYGRAANQVANSVNSNFSSAGRYGSGAQNDVLGKNLGDLATNIYGGAYAQDQANRLNAIQMAPTFGNQAYQDASQLLNVGQIQQDQAQNPLDFKYQQYQEQQNLPYKQLAAMSGVFGSNLGSSSTTQNSQSSGGGK